MDLIADISAMTSFGHDNTKLLTRKMNSLNQKAELSKSFIVVQIEVGLDELNTFTISLCFTRSKNWSRRYWNLESSGTKIVMKEPLYSSYANNDQSLKMNFMAAVHSLP